eukprot:6172615-Pleurochrysis_carterae.AAC.3
MDEWAVLSYACLCMASMHACVARSGDKLVGTSDRALRLAAALASATVNQTVLDWRSWSSRRSSIRCRGVQHTSSVHFHSSMYLQRVCCVCSTRLLCMWSSKHLKCFCSAFNRALWDRNSQMRSESALFCFHDLTPHRACPDVFAVDQSHAAVVFATAHERASCCSFFSLPLVLYSVRRPLLPAMSQLSTRL